MCVVLKQYWNKSKLKWIKEMIETETQKEGKIILN